MAGVTHKLIADTAKQMAAEVYEVLAKDNAFFRRFPRRRHYVAAQWPVFVPDARATLAQMLTGDAPQGVKDQIEEALMLDRPLRDKTVGTVTGPAGRTKH